MVNEEMRERFALAAGQVAQMALSGRISATATRLLLRILLREYAEMNAQHREACPVLNSRRECRAENPSGCRYHHPKGTTRERAPKGETRRVCRVDQRQPMHKQVGALAAAIEHASRDGAKLEAVIYRPEFGELTLDCGNPGKATDPIGKGGHGVQHALEERHGISAKEIAETLLLGKVTQKEEKSSRLEIRWQQSFVVLEREMKQHSGRISRTQAKLHTAYKI